MSEFEHWRALLLAAVRREHETRTRLADGGASFSGYNAEIEAVHLDNADLLARVFDAIGWPGRAALGDEGASAAFVILQHAISRPDLQRRGLALMLDAIAQGQANALDAAFLSDRIAVMEGAAQTFGTQFDWDADGLLSPAPIAEPERVNDRRADLGLAPMAQTVAEMRANAAAEGETAPADLVQRRADFDAWARRVGWRA